MCKYRIVAKRVKKGTVTADFMEDALHEVMRVHKGMEMVSLKKVGNYTFKYKAVKRASDNPFTLREIAALEEKGWEILSIKKVDDFTEKQVNQIEQDNDVYGYNQEVDSSWIKKINYNNNKKELEITTNSDFEYVYVDVPVRIFQDFLAADSAGRYFNKMIKGKFERKGE